MFGFPELLWVIVAAAFGIVLIVLVLWLVPKWQVSSLKADYNRKELKQLENEFRKTLAQILGGIAIIGGLFATWNSMEVSRRTLELSQEGQITERFTRAINQLGDSKLEVRLGGIYALERIARDSEKDHWAVMEVLTAFVRENAPWKGDRTSGEERETHSSAKEGRPKLRADIQAILTVIGRRERTFGQREDKRLDLYRTDLRGYNLSYAKLQGVVLRESCLGGAYLFTAHLEEANLMYAILSRADLIDANLEDAYLWGANLEGANLEGANLEGANLSEAKLKEASLKGANLKEAILKGANLRGADLEGAFLLGAILQGAKYLNIEQLAKAKTLYNAQLDPELLQRIKKDYPHLLEKPKEDGSFWDKQ
jgi:hypothetical protein